MENPTAVLSASEQAKTRRPLMKRVIAAACAAVFVCAASIGAYAYYKTPISYLSLDINPSVELGVNAFGKVVSAMAYNSDGATILDGKNLFGSDVKNAVNLLVKSAAQKGFVAEDGSTVIAVTSETDNSTTAADLQDSAEQGADAAIKSEGDTASVVKENVALERREEAQELGITPGKLNLIQKLQALDSSITVDEYKDAKVTDIMNKFVELKKETLTDQGNDGSSASSGNDSQTSSQASSSESGNGNGKASAAQSRNGNANQNSSQNATASSGSDSSSSGTVDSQSENNKGANSNAGGSANAANNSNKGSNGNGPTKSGSDSLSSGTVSSQSESEEDTSTNADAGSINTAGNSNKEANGNKHKS